MSLIDPKPSPRPWFAVWRRESGTFAQLPLLARSIFTEVLKLTDDDGVIDIGTRAPAEAIAWALGADRSDRRALAKYVPMLLKDGCLVHEGTTLRAPSFRRWQPTSKRSKSAAANEREATTNEHDGVANEPRTNRDAATTRSRSDHETEAKCAEPFTPDLHSREEERRGEERENKKTPPSPPAPAPGERIRELEARYPAELATEARQACALARRNGRMSDGRWLATLERLAKLPAPDVIDAMRMFVERYADGAKDERYLEGIARNAARGKGHGRTNGAHPPSSINPESAAETRRKAADVFGQPSLPEVVNG